MSNISPPSSFVSLKYEVAPVDVMKAYARCTGILTYLLTPWCRVLLETLTGLQLVKKFPAFHGTRRFITALKSVRQLSLSWASPIQSIYPHPTSWRSVLNIIRPSTPRSPQWCLSLRFPHQYPIHPPLLTHTRPMPSPSHSSRFITRTGLGEEYKSFSFSLCSLLHFPVTSSLPGPNILLNTIFSNTLSFLSSRNVSDQVSNPYKTTGKIIVLYSLIFKFLDSSYPPYRRPFLYPQPVYRYSCTYS